MRRAEIRAPLRRDRRVRRDRALPRHAGQALLERDVGPPRVRRRGAPRAGDPARRRGARGRRRRLPAQVAGEDGRGRRARAGPSSSSPTTSRSSRRSASAACCSSAARSVADAPGRARRSTRYLRTLERAAADDLLEPRPTATGAAGTRRWSARSQIRDAGGGHPDVVVGGRAGHDRGRASPRSLPLMRVPADDREQPRPAGRRRSTARSPRRSDVRDPASGPRIECDDRRAAAAARAATASTSCSRARQQIQDGLQAAAFFDVEPGVVDGPPDRRSSGTDGDVVLAHAGGCPAE